VKIKISTEIEIPDEYLEPSAKYASAVQILFDDVTNYVTVGCRTSARCSKMVCRV
jgi:hypothetical protein